MKKDTPQAQIIRQRKAEIRAERNNTMNINDKVVHVGMKHIPSSERHPPNFSLITPAGRPIEGTVYVISGYYYAENYPDLLGLRLVGLPIFHPRTGEELGWDSRGFRLLDMVKLENRLAQSEDEPSRAAAERSAP